MNDTTIKRPHHRTKRRFGEHEVYADCVLDHDVYSHFRVSIEVPRNQESIGEVFLNGKSVGYVELVKDANKKMIGFTAYRGKLGNGIRIGIEGSPIIFEKLGRAVASILSDLMQ